MKVFVRVLCLAVTSVIAVFTLAPLSANAVADSLSIAPSSQSGSPGSNFTVNIHEDSGTDAMNAVQANLTYSTSMLKVVSSTINNGWSTVNNNTSTAGLIKLTAFPFDGSNPTTYTGDQVFATVVFQALNSGTANIDFGCDLNSCPSYGNAITRASDNANILATKTGATVTTTYTDTLSSGQTLSAGQSLVSQNIRFKLAMQGDGNLVLYGNNVKPLWNSGTPGSGGNRVVMQADGNLVIYTSGNKAVWASSTPGQGASSLHVQDDGNVVVYNNSSVPTWNAGVSGNPVYVNFGADRLTNTQSMPAGRYLKTTDGGHALLFQWDGNLVLYGPGYHVLWATYTNGLNGTNLVMQGDGNLVMYTSGNKPVWASGTNGHGSSSAILQADGNFVIYAGATPTFSTGTDGKF